MSHNIASAEHHGHHIVSKKLLAKVFGALVFLTVVTVVVAQVHLGPLNVPIALAIAATKAALVIMIFMGLKFDSPMNTLVFSVGVVWVMVFLTFTLFDTVFRGDLGNVQSDTIADQQRQEQLLRAREPKGPSGTVPPDSVAPQRADTMASTVEDSVRAAGQAQ